MLLFYSSELVWIGFGYGFIDGTNDESSKKTLIKGERMII